MVVAFPISRDPPEGGTPKSRSSAPNGVSICFQFLGIPPKGEPSPFNRDKEHPGKFPISRDPPEGGTLLHPHRAEDLHLQFPISRDPPEGGTVILPSGALPPPNVSNF